jgi:methyl-accepting chemotaxis protein
VSGHRRGAGLRDRNRTFTGQGELMRRRLDVAGRNIRYSVFGFVLGISAPLGWTLIHLLLFPQPEKTIWGNIAGDVVKDAYSMALYAYMGIGTAMVMGVLGFFIGKAQDNLYENAQELNELHQEVASQKELFENRYKVLDTNIKNFHQISSRIQKSISVDEVLKLCIHGLHDILGYERVNLLMADDERANLDFVAATGSDGYDIHGVSVPLDERSGIIYRCFRERQLFLIDDIGKCPKEYYLQPPFNTIPPLRSKSFVICPIVVKGESVGIFGIDNKFSHRTLNDTDVDTILLLADQAASALTRIGLIKSIDTLTLELGKTFSELLQQQEHHSRNVFSLQNAVSSMTDSTSHIASASEGVMVSVGETSSAVGDISLAIDQVSRNLDSLADAVDKTVSAMEEINASLKHVEENTAVSHRVASEVRSQAEKGRTVVDETISALADIQDSVEFSYLGMCRLAENSSRIDSIINVINDITKRTNLLALNASIIAAQAGEHGKGFGVVADEIRNLSIQTGQSTGEITAIIEQIMHESRGAATNVTMTKDLVQKGVKLGMETGESLKVILASSQNAMDMTEQIKFSTEEQATSVRLVTQSMEDVSTMTSQIFNASKEQVNATQSIGKSIDAIKGMTREMVGATTRQVHDGSAIKKSVEAVGEMVLGIFEDLESRRAESSVVVKELEMMKEIAK